MDATEKAIRGMSRLATKATEQKDPNPGGIYGFEWLYHDAADTIAGVFDQMTPGQQEMAQYQSRRAANAIFTVPKRNRISIHRAAELLSNGSWAKEKELVDEFCEKIVEEGPISVEIEGVKYDVR